jgi:hypothetical protein
MPQPVLLARWTVQSSGTPAPRTIRPCPNGQKDHANQHQMPHQQTAPTERRVNCVPEKRGRQSGYSAARSPERERSREPSAARTSRRQTRWRWHRSPWPRVRKAFAAGSDPNGVVHHLAEENRESENSRPKTPTRRPERDSLVDAPTDPRARPHYHAPATHARSRAYTATSAARTTGVLIRDSTHPIP